MLESSQCLSSCATLILGITSASNPAHGFIAGMIVARHIKWDKLSV
jgi:hypothetical protein